MDKGSSGKEFNTLSDAHAEARAEVRPYWKERELTAEHSAAARRRRGVDVPFLVLTLLLLVIGVIMVLSASFAREYYTTGVPTRLFMRQLAFAASGVALMLIVSHVRVRTMSRWSMPLLIVAVGLLILVLVAGVKVNGARRWLSIGGRNSAMTFQPSEIAKFALILASAQMICVFGKTRMKTFKYGVLPFILLAGVLAGLVVVETHLSAAIIITVLAIVLMFAGGTRLRWFAIAVLIIAAALGLLLLVCSRMALKEEETPEVANSSVTGISSDTGRAASPDDAEGGKPGIKEILKQTDWEELGFGYAGRRINAWIEPEADKLGAGFQICQSLNAIGSGGLLGQGLGQSRQKYLYLPEEHNDYIFAIVCEELGYIGAILILMLFALLIVRGYWLAIRAADKFSSLIVTGVTSLLAIQVFLNVAVVTNIIPATGISLPFFSSGGTALWIQLVQVGVVLSVSRGIEPVKQPEEAAEESGGEEEPAV